MRIYFMGIAGTAMGNAALLLRAAGHEVSGSDEGVYPPMSDVLRDAGIAFFEGYDAERLAQSAPDLIVIGNALSRGNPEIEWLLESRAIPFRSLPAVLSEFVLSGRQNIVIAGTHGKTTTTAIAAHLLRGNHCDPGFLIGGVPQDPPTGTHFGTKTDPFVIEGDEYDSAFFDKRSKFIHYSPHVAVLNNLEFDHADIFRDLADIERAFDHFLRIVPRNGFAVWNADDENLARLLPVSWTQSIRVSANKGAEADVHIVGFEEGPDGASFNLTWWGKEWGTVSWSLPGLFNARNAAMAATAAALTLFPDDPTRLDLSPLAKFRGVRRRQQIHIQRDDLVVIEDFGHHPTAIKETIRSLRARFPSFAITVAFEPRSNTARTNMLQDQFQSALGEADNILIGPVDRADRLSDSERFDTVAVTKAIRSMGKDARACGSNEEVFDCLTNSSTVPANQPRLIAFFTNGSFGGLIARTCEAFS